MWGLAEILCETIHGFPNLRIFRAFRECRYAAPWLNNPVRVSTSEQITISRMLLVGLCKLELESKKPLLGAIFNSVFFEYSMRLKIVAHENLVPSLCPSDELCMLVIRC